MTDSGTALDQAFTLSGKTALVTGGVWVLQKPSLSL